MKLCLECNKELQMLEDLSKKNHEEYYRCYDCEIDMIYTTTLMVTPIIED